QKIYMSVAQNSDGIIVMYDSTKDLEKQKQEMEKVIKKFRISRPMIEVMGKKAIDTEKLKESIWGMLGLIRVYTKTGKRPEKRALVLKKGATVEDAARHLHKDFIKFFKFARVWGRSAKHSGQHFGLEHVLKDGDILEFHLKR
ncbi:MAG: TGS domain-containing protein, partial [Candidatus Aenigmatarchaeota archaeon]